MDVAVLEFAGCWSAMTVVSPVLGEQESELGALQSLQLSWLWGSLGCRGGTEPLGIATEEKSVEP